MKSPNFQQQKTTQLSRKDKSHIGEWDKKIKKLCNKINKKKNYYTTSSCAGRVVLLKASDKKQPNLFLFVTHNKISSPELKKQLNLAVKKYKKLIYFKQECCGLHVACETLAATQNLLDKAKFAGWKNSGIIASRKRFICHFRSTEKLELPIADKGKILVSDELLKLLASESNKKLSRTWQKIKNLEKLL